MSKKTYADICLERTKKATEEPWITPYTELTAHARTDIPELARRLKEAIDELRSLSTIEGFEDLKDLAYDLEAPLEDKE